MKIWSEKFGAYLQRKLGYFLCFDILRANYDSSNLAMFEPGSRPRQTNEKKTNWLTFCPGLVLIAWWTAKRSGRALKVCGVCKVFQFRVVFNGQSKFDKVRKIFHAKTLQIWDEQCLVNNRTTFISQMANVTLIRQLSTTMLERTTNVNQRLQTIFGPVQNLFKDIPSLLLCIVYTDLIYKTSLIQG